MFKLILIAGGAIAMATAPANAGGKPSPTSQLLNCLGCPGLLTPGMGGSPITAGNLNAAVKANVGGAGVTNGRLLSVSVKAGMHGNGDLSAKVKARANVPTINLGGCGCE